MGRTVHIAGFGAVTGFGAGRAALEDGVFSGRRAVRPRERSAPWNVPTSVAAEAPGLEAVPLADQGFAMGCRAAREALASVPSLDPGAVPLVMASTKGELTGVGQPGDPLGGPGAELTTGTGLGSPARLGKRIARSMGLPSVLGTVSCACASGIMALALAARRMQHDGVERVLVLGVDALSPFVVAGFGALHALDPGLCRPFDRARRGVSLGDGAGAILLSIHENESLGAAITGHGGANDACHVTGPDREGKGLALATQRALSMAQLAPRDVGMIHLHGTGTEANDSCEALGMVGVFGGRTPPAFGTKAQTGHTLGAAGILETGVTLMALQRGELAVNVGLVDVGVDDRLDLVREVRPLESRTAIKVAAGFGGVVAALAVEA